MGGRSDRALLAASLLPLQYTVEKPRSRIVLRARLHQSAVSTFSLSVARQTAYRQSVESRKGLK